VRADSIIPMGPDLSYVGERPFDPITLDIWLDDEAGCTLFDDSGGETELVHCRARRLSGETTLEVSASHKEYLAQFHHCSQPAKVLVNGVAAPGAATLDELQQMPAGWWFDPASTLTVRFTAAGNRSLVTITG